MCTWCWIRRRNTSSTTEGSAFEDGLAAVLSEQLRVNVLLSLREDALAKLDRFKGRIHHPRQLPPLGPPRPNRRRGGDRRPARAPARRSGRPRATIEAPLTVERVLDEAAVGRITAARRRAGGRRPPTGRRGSRRSFLQLVTQRPLGGRASPPAANELRIATTRAARGAAAGSWPIISSALLRRWSSGQQDIASRLFNHLVTPSGAKIAQQAADLAEYAGVEEADVTPVLGSLSDHRIVRRDDGGRYEIFHDVLAEAVLAWRVRHERERAVERAARRPAGGIGAAECSPLGRCSRAFSLVLRRSAGIERGTPARRRGARLRGRSKPAPRRRWRMTPISACSWRPRPHASCPDPEPRMHCVVRCLRVGSVPWSGPRPAGGRRAAGHGLLVTGGDTGRALVARMRDGAVVGSFDQHAPITALAVSRRGTWH